MARRVSREFTPLPDPAPSEPPQPPPQEQERCLSAACLDACAIIAVSAVGAGFLVIPTIIDAAGGVLPTAVGLTLAWLFLALGGIAYVEAATTILRQNEAGGASIFAVGRHCFGTVAAVIISVIFMVQMIATVTANVAKSAQLLHGTTGLGYEWGVVLPPAAISALVFGVPRPLTQRINTVLTAAMVLGFLALFAATLISSPMSTDKLEHDDPVSLLPQHGWVVPVFLNTVRFGEGVPVVVQTLGPARRRTACTAVLCGSALPLVLAVLWAVISSLAADSDPLVDPVLALMRSPHWAIAWSSRAVTLGAVGGHLIEVYLTCSQLAADALGPLIGRAAGGPSRAVIHSSAAPCEPRTNEHGGGGGASAGAGAGDASGGGHGGGGHGGGGGSGGGGGGGGHAGGHGGGLPAEAPRRVRALYCASNACVVCGPMALAAIGPEVRWPLLPPLTMPLLPPLTMPLLPPLTMLHP